MPDPSLSPPAQASRRAPWLTQECQTVKAAILRTIIYADIFDYPLTTQEIHRYLSKMPASLDTIRAVLGHKQLIPRQLTCQQGYFTLRGREFIVETRLRRAQVAAHMWPRAMRYGSFIAGLPFVRMVTVTGALTMDNVEPGDDIDYLIVTEPGRLWLCRAMVIVLVKIAARQGDILCPNYLLTERALVFHERNLFTAHEVTQMVPLAGLETYRRLRQLNAWTAHFLPNAHDPPRHVNPIPLPRQPVRTLTEAALRTPIGDRLEQWEMKRKMLKFSQQHIHQGNAALSPDWCKGHFNSHDQHILSTFVKRLQTIEKQATQ